MFKEIELVKSIEEIKISFDQPEEYYFNNKELESVLNKNKIKSLGARYMIKKSILDFLELKDEFHSIEILNELSGRPMVRFMGEVKKCMENKGIQNVYISISHSRNFVSTLVVIE